MLRFDRLFGILLLLRGGRQCSAAELAERFGVSRRTIFRDLEALSLAGIPVYAERGRNGGIRLLEGYFLQPLMFSRSEAVALLLGLTLLRGLRVVPFPGEVDSAARKLLAAVPDHLRATLAHAERVLGVEQPAADIFHPEPADSPDSAGTTEPDTATEGAVVTTFLQALLDNRALRLRYKSPYRSRESIVDTRPLGLFWDRDRWYLAGLHKDAKRPWRLWRADRVVAIAPGEPRDTTNSDFDVRALLGHTWLQEAMAEWRRRAPVRLRVTPEQADRLRQDWYYRHAYYEPEPCGRISMTFGEGDPDAVLPLLRWLGPGAELIEPAEWRALLRDDLTRMLALYQDS